MNDPEKPIPIYSTPGDFEAFLHGEKIFNLLGEWVGWVTGTKDVYSVHGDYVGWLTDDPRILRKRTYNYDKPKLQPPKHPEKIYPPATVPLPPMMAELSFDTIDVFQEEPDRLPTVDSGEYRSDLD